MTFVRRFPIVDDIVDDVVDDVVDPYYYDPYYVDPYYVDPYVGDVVINENYIVDDGLSDRRRYLRRGDDFHRRRNFGYGPIRREFGHVGGHGGRRVVRSGHGGHIGGHVGRVSRGHSGHGHGR